jgi:hypothetical protein
MRLQEIVKLAFDPVEGIAVLGARADVGEAPAL